MIDSNANVASLTVSREAPAATASGYVMLLIMLLALGAGAWGIFDTASKGAIGPFAIVAGTLVFVFVLCGFYMLQPNQAAAITLFGSYRGTDRTSGLRWVMPWLIRKKVSVRANNMISERLKVNDARGNPIEIAAQVVWRVTDTAQALFDIDDYKAFVIVQTEAAVRTIGSRYAYDDLEHSEEVTLRGSHEVVNAELRAELIERLRVAGIMVDECGLTHLAYAQEIAGAMLRRQQAQAVVAARATLVAGAVGMVEMALDSLSEKGVVELDDERRAAMVSNLMVVLCGEREAQPVVNTGTLYQ
jgi:regulator of protease activity HflC (stomatin/prohibitin superfamily)